MRPVSGLLLVGVLMLVGPLGCDLLGNLSRVGTTYTIEFEVPPVQPNSNFSATQQANFKAKLDSIMRANNISDSDLNNARVDSIRFTILSPSNGTFDFVQSISIWLSSPSLGEQQVLGAGPGSISPGRNSVVLPALPTADILAYIRGGPFTARAEGRSTSTGTSTTYRIQAVLYTNISFDVFP
ncbi:MAG: hypothetical protein N2561_04280 [Bacteroidetes bacterium]|nr:hypothetical protein [Rhodothermia bacterium]MCS7154227.1 hypothetical protein [Bacteroidota bacterium]MCX7906737.1 hypothetical protein [Bacteroidota bacterium]MDW8136983.1 hypothetical protein [Bacteroidota bacterium]MDW8285146.1 hypothetical protein [Bacteroidota bacterium]